MAWIIVGIIAGWLAKRVIPGEGPRGVPGDLVIGVVGAIAGGWIFNYFGHTGATGVNIGSIVVAFVGAVVRALADAATYWDEACQTGIVTPKTLASTLGVGRTGPAPTVNARKARERSGG